MYLEMPQDVCYGWLNMPRHNSLIVTKLAKFCFLLVYYYIVTRGPESTIEQSTFSNVHVLFFRWAGSKLCDFLTTVFTWNSSILRWAVQPPIAFSQLCSNLTKCSKDALKYGFVRDSILFVHTHTKCSRDNQCSLQCRAPHQGDGSLLTSSSTWVLKKWHKMSNKRHWKCSTIAHWSELWHHIHGDVHARPQQWCGQTHAWTNYLLCESFRYSL